MWAILKAFHHINTLVLRNPRLVGRAVGIWATETWTKFRKKKVYQLPESHKDMEGVYILQQGDVTAPVVLIPGATGETLGFLCVTCEALLEASEDFKKSTIIAIIPPPSARTSLSAYRRYIEKTARNIGEDSKLSLATRVVETLAFSRSGSVWGGQPARIIAENSKHSVNRLCNSPFTKQKTFPQLIHTIASFRFLIDLCMTFPLLIGAPLSPLFRLVQSIVTALTLREVGLAHQRDYLKRSIEEIVWAPDIIRFANDSVADFELLIRATEKEMAILRADVLKTIEGQHTIFISYSAGDTWISYKDHLNALAIDLVDTAHLHPILIQDDGLHADAPRTDAGIKHLRGEHYGNTLFFASSDSPTKVSITLDVIWTAFTTHRPIKPGDKLITGDSISLQERRDRQHAADLLSFQTEADRLMNGDD